MIEPKLERMANDVAAFFKPYPEPEAIEEVRKHLRAFWTPRMRERLLAEVAAGRTEKLDPLVIAAAKLLAEANPA
jgi:formate dehydrogenase subunit delta